MPYPTKVINTNGVRYSSNLLIRRQGLHPLVTSGLYCSNRDNVIPLKGTGIPANAGVFVSVNKFIPA